MDADELKAWMKRYRRTIRGLAVELGVSRATVERWRAGEARIPRSVELALLVLAEREPPPRGTGGDD